MTLRLLLARFALEKLDVESSEGVASEGDGLDGCWWSVRWTSIAGIFLRMLYFH